MQSDRRERPKGYRIIAWSAVALWFLWGWAGRQLVLDAELEGAVCMHRDRDTVYYVTSEPLVWSVLMVIVMGALFSLASCFCGCCLCCRQFTGEAPWHGLAQPERAGSSVPLSDTQP